MLAKEVSGAAHRGVDRKPSKNRCRRRKRGRWEILPGDGTNVERFGTRRRKEKNIRPITLDTKELSRAKGQGSKLVGRLLNRGWQNSGRIFAPLRREGKEKKLEEGRCRGRQEERNSVSLLQGSPRKKDSSARSTSQPQYTRPGTLAKSNWPSKECDREEIGHRSVGARTMFGEIRIPSQLHGGTGSYRD